jgi:hypothetical protein
VRTAEVLLRVEGVGDGRAVRAWDAQRVDAHGCSWKNGFAKLSIILIQNDPRAQGVHSLRAWERASGKVHFQRTLRWLSRAPVVLEVK